MRQIKFRAWSNRDKKMKYTEGEEIILPPYGIYPRSKFVVLNHKMGKVCHESFAVGWQDGELMEWTGIENIYEGDILFFPELDKYADVFFNEGSFQILLPGEDESVNLTTQFLDANYVEVAGNVFENPELIGLDKMQ